MMPLQIGAPDVAFPRLNMFAYWLYFFGGIIAGAGFLTPGGAAAFGWFAYAPLSDNTYSPDWAVTCGSSARRSVASAPSSVRSTSSPRSCACAPRHDHVPDADLHLDRAGHLDPGAAHLPGLAPRCSRSAPTGGSARTCSTRTTAGRCSGSTSSGSSGTQRSTSSPCPSSASSPRCCRSSRASRSSATRPWSTRRSASPPCRSASGRTTCTSPARCCCRSSRS